MTYHPTYAPHEPRQQGLPGHLPGWHHNARGSAGRSGRKLERGERRPLPTGRPRRRPGRASGPSTRRNHPDKSTSVAAQEARVDYRLGEQSVSSLAVWFLGFDVIAEHVAYCPGARHSR